MTAQSDVFPRTYLQFVGTVDQGLQLEVLPAGVNGQPLGADALTTVLGDGTDRLWVQLYDVSGILVRIPLVTWKGLLNQPRLKRTVKRGTNGILIKFVRFSFDP